MSHVIRPDNTALELPSDGGWLEVTGHRLAPTSRARKASTPSDIVAQWREQGPLVRVPTGIGPLDECCRGGLPVPWRMLIVGAPSAGKTFVGTSIAHAIARRAGEEGLCVGMLAVDEEPDDVTVRLAQVAGYTVAQAELRDAEQLLLMADDLRGLRIRLYDASWTIEEATSDLATWAESETRRGALFIDSIQTARSKLSEQARSPREAVDANLSAIRSAATEHRLLVVATSEANRASYRSDDAVQHGNDLAAGAESRAIEFGAQTLLMLRTPKEFPNVIHVRVAKNRRALHGEFWLELDRDRHTLTPCKNPLGTPAEQADKAADSKMARSIARVQKDAEGVAALLARHPGGLGTRTLRDRAKANLGLGVERLGAALQLLEQGHKGVRLEIAAQGAGKATIHRLVQEQESDDDQ